MRRFLFAVLTCAAMALPAVALDVPPLTGRVNDGANLLGPDSSAKIEKTLVDYEQKTGRQFAVLTIPSLDGEAIEDYSIKVARAWKLGTKGKDDGILLLIARNDRQARIEVGYGLEGELPDVLAGRIIRNEIAPRMREGDPASGIAAGVDAVIKTLNGTYSPAPDVRPQDGMNLARMGTLDKILASLFIFGILGLFESVGLGAPGLGWFIYFFLIPFWAAFPMSIWGVNAGLAFLGAHLIGFPILKTFLSRTEWGKRAARRYAAPSARHYIGGSTWTSGGIWTSGGGWSSGGGGFSGGGGSFGGGGASGNW